MFPYLPNTEADQEKMLKVIGISSAHELFQDIPVEVKLQRELRLNSSHSEIELTSKVKAITDKNMDTSELTCFLGAGAYDHYIPSVVKHLISRSEFYTAYTPYQPEISQGTLQAIFEYQTMICNLTGMEAANASMYDGATACAEAAIMACQATKRSKIIASRTVHPETRRVLKTYLRFRDMELIEIDDLEGTTDVSKLKECLNGEIAAVIIQNPNFFGCIEELKEIEELVHANKALLIMSVDPISLGILKSPAELGADIAVGEGQSLGNSLSFGGPYLGFLATNSKLMRKMPGRIVGKTTDVDGKRGFVLTLQAREQHIRREKATSNICSNEALNALTATIYLTTLGKEGIKEAAKQCASKAHYAFNEAVKSGKFKPLFNKSFFMEFALKSDMEAKSINEELLKNNILGGFDLGAEYPHYKNAMLLCVTEKRTRKEIDALIKTMEGIK